MTGNCDNCRKYLKKECFDAGTWSYKCPYCGFRYLHGEKPEARQVLEFICDQAIKGMTPNTTEAEADAVHDHIASAEILDWLGSDTGPNLGPQEPPQDYRIWNKRQPDGTFKPITQFFDEAVKMADPRTPAQIKRDEANKKYDDWVNSPEEVAFRAKRKQEWLDWKANHPDASPYRFGGSVYS